MSVSQLHVINEDVSDVKNDKLRVGSRLVDSGILIDTSNINVAGLSQKSEQEILDFKEIDVKLNFRKEQSKLNFFRIF